VSSSRLDRAAAVADASGCAVHSALVDFSRY